MKPPFGLRRMGAGPAGIAGMNIRTGETKYVVSVPFQIGHMQSNPWVPGQIVNCQYQHQGDEYCRANAQGKQLLARSWFFRRAIRDGR